MKKDAKSQPLSETLKISVRNFGPIGEAKDVALRPLTIFVGPSNTGKSYMAILAYSLLRTISEMLPKRERYNPISMTWRITSTDEFISRWEKKIAPALVEAYDAFQKSGEPRESFKLPPDVLEFAREMAASQLRVFAVEWADEITRCMGAQWNDLSLKDGKSVNSGVGLQTRNDWHGISWGLDKNMKPTMNTESLLINDSNIVQATGFRFLSRLHSEGFLTKNADTDKTWRRYMLRRSFHGFVNWTAKQLFSNEQTTTPFYLPAARTGVMQSHRAIAAAMVRRSSLVAVESLSIPVLSGVFSDFLEKLILMDSHKETDLKSIADDLEKQVIGGVISAERPTQGYPHFSYAQNGVKIPLSRASSMVTELAPISLFLRHYVEKGNTIIIEEPEAHLHPEAQRGIAQAIVRLVRAGVRVIITTHSDYVLEQISNHIRLSSLDESERKKLKKLKLASDSDLYLNPSEVGAYLFAKPTRKGQGTKVRELKFDLEAGIAPDDHDVVSSALYNETVSIIERVTAQ